MDQLEEVWCTGNKQMVDHNHEKYTLLMVRLTKNHRTKARNMGVQGPVYLLSTDWSGETILCLDDAANRSVLVGARDYEH